jgi:hypothetical protein
MERGQEVREDASVAKRYNRSSLARGEKGGSVESVSNSNNMNGIVE